MQMLNKPVVVPPIDYPSSDGKRMAENTLHGRWISTIYGNLCSRFRDRADVFVAADNLWYPVEGHPEVRTAPDVYVVFGRPKGDRGSYQQWREGGVPLTAVFEILAPTIPALEIVEKFDFYDQYGVEEYYIYDPDNHQFSGWERRGERLVKVSPAQNHVSPRLAIRFDMSGPELVIYHPDDRRFLTFVELYAAVESLRRKRESLLELNRKLRLGQATPDELKELESLEGP